LVQFVAYLGYGEKLFWTEVDVERYFPARGKKLISGGNGF